MRAYSVCQRQAKQAVTRTLSNRTAVAHAESTPSQGVALPHTLRANLEVLSHIDLSGVRVHHDSPRPAALDADAYTRGRDIHLGPGQERHLPHEAWHAVQQASGRAVAQGLRVGGITINADPALEAEADRMGARAALPTAAARAPMLRHAGPPAASAPVQRAVRVGGGATKINDKDYQKGGPKEKTGKRALVRDLAADPQKRVFNDVAELDSFAEGSIDNIGDVKTGVGTFWYRVPSDKLTVLGEEHDSAKGNFEDVVVGLHTSRFKYEPFHETTEVAGLKSPGTEKRVGEMNQQYRVNAEVKPGSKPALENAVVKAAAGATIVREFISKNPPTMDAATQKEWGSRASTSDYSGGDRAALYLALGIHIAKDLADQKLGPMKKGEPWITGEAKRLADFYTAKKTDLDSLMTKKDADPLIGIYELAKATKFAIDPVMQTFAELFHDYAARYIEQLGKDIGNKTLEKEGTKLAANKNPNLDDLSPAREEIMWSKVEEAKANKFLLVGMGDEHRKNLTRRLDKAGIAHFRVETSLADQKKAVETAFVP